MLSGDPVAEIRGRYARSGRYILIRHFSPISYVRSANVGFYGFVFSREHSMMFATDRMSIANDVISAHEGDQYQCLFKIEED